MAMEKGDEIQRFFPSSNRYSARFGSGDFEDGRAKELRV